jgi:Nuclease-related domain
VAGAGLALVAAAAAWFAWHADGRTRSWLAVLAALCVALAWLCRPRPDPGRWLRGAAGEAATAALLDRLSARRWAVWHDLAIPGSRANVDHLVIGPTGVWVIDSKTTRARVRCGWRHVRFGTQRLDSGRTRWEAQVVSDRLGVRVRPLIVVHGGGLRRRGGRSGRIRVVPASRLVRHLRRWRSHLDRSERARLVDRVGEVFFPAAKARQREAAGRG